MNKVFRGGVFLVIIVAFAACAHKFRVNMRCGYGPIQPSNPIAKSPCKAWMDIAHWQSFLRKHGCGLAGPAYPNDIFDQETAEATKRFQRSRLGGDPLPVINGVVNWATYYKAVKAGMPDYPTVLTPFPPHSRSFHVLKINAGATGDILQFEARDNALALDITAGVAKAQELATGTPDYFRIGLTLNDSATCYPTGSYAPPPPARKRWNDWIDWQNFLIDYGLLDNTTAKFDQNTAVQTQKFQVQGKPYLSGTGIVDRPTYDKAISLGMSPCTPIPHPGP